MTWTHNLTLCNPNISHTFTSITHLPEREDDESGYHEDQSEHHKYTVANRLPSSIVKHLSRLREADKQKPYYTYSIHKMLPFKVFLASLL